MIEVRDVQTLDGKTTNYFIESVIHRTIDAKGLTLLPALIDPPVHFRIPGAEHKEDWRTAAKAAIRGGVTTVFDMPNTTPSCITKERLEEKMKLIDSQLFDAKIPLRYRLYLGADRSHLNEIGKTKREIIGLKIYMGSSTGDLLMDDKASLERAFEIAKKEDVLVAIHAEDEEMIQKLKKKHEGKTDPALHSVIRPPIAAARAVEQAISLVQKYHTRLYIAHMSTKGELDLVRAAKKQKLPVFAEATPHHLFLDDRLYGKIGASALVNPPLRSQREREALWEAVHDGTIDTIGTDHAPHTLEEKKRPFGSAPSGFPSIELYLALLLNAYHEKKISLEKIVSLTHTNPQEIFRLKPNSDVVLIDLNKIKRIDNPSLATKAKWSPYEGWTLKGWPRYTICQGQVFDI